MKECSFLVPACSGVFVAVAAVCLLGTPDRGGAQTQGAGGAGWVELHPRPVDAAWTERDPLARGNQNWTAMASSHDGLRLAGAVMGGKIYTSPDGGQNWTERDPEIGGQKLGNQNWRAITSSDDGQKLAAAVQGGKIYTSLDGGQNWTERDPLNLGNQTWRSITSSQDGQKLAAVVAGGKIYTSEDGGATWKGDAKIVRKSSYSDDVNQYETDSSWASIASSADGMKLAAVNGGQWDDGDLCLSSDGGKTWKRVEKESGWGYLEAKWLSVASSSDGKKLVAVAYAGFIYTSDDGGGTWKIRSAIGARNWTGIASSKDGKKLAAVVESGRIYTSADGGETWNSQEGPGDRGWGGIASSGDGTKLAAAVSGGKVWTVTGLPVEPAPADASPLTRDQNWISIAASKDGKKLVAAVAGGKLYTSNDGGKVWTPRGDQDENWQTVSSSADGNKLAAVVNGKIQTSTDGGEHWTGRSEATNWGSIVWSADGNTLLAIPTSFGKINVSTNGGQNWVERGDAGLAWSAIASSADGTKLAAVGMEQRPLGGYFRIRTSENGGANWTVRENWTAQENQSERQFQTIASSADGMTLAAGTLWNDRIRLSTDGGKTWNDVGGAPDGKWKSIAISADGRRLAAADRGSILTSADRGSTWTKLDAAGSRQWQSIALSGEGNLVAAVASEDRGPHVFGDPAPFLSKISNQEIRKNHATSAIPLEVTDLDTPLADLTITYASDNLGLVDPSQILLAGSGENRTITVRPSAYGLGVANIQVQVSDGNASDQQTFQIRVTQDAATNWTKRASAGERVWSAIATSRDGTKLAAAVKGGLIHTSADGGASWTPRNPKIKGQPLGNQKWSAIVTSGDGKNLAAAVAGGKIYSSTDGGENWAERNPGAPGSSVWSSMTSSEDGKKLVVAAEDGRLFTSDNGGASWTERSPAGTAQPTLKWAALASSVDGAKLAAVASGGQVVTSGDGGATWTSRESAGTRNWVAVSSSGDGSRLAASVQGGALYLSADGGATWTEREAAFPRAWASIASSSDGSRLVAVERGGVIHLSSDSGATWTQWEKSAGSGEWSAVGSSADGRKLVAAVAGGGIYTADGSQGPVISGIADRGIPANQDTGPISFAIQDEDTPVEKLTVTVEADNPQLVTSAGLVLRGSGGNREITVAPLADQVGTALITVHVSDGQQSDTTRFQLTVVKPLRWTERIPKPSGNRTANQNWSALAASADGTKLAAVVSGGLVYSSRDGGRSWTERDPGNRGNQIWSAIASSADGTKLAAAVSGGKIHTSTDGGAVWTPRGDQNRAWIAIASSADGTKLAAAVKGGPIHTSGDGGATWTERKPLGEEGRNWTALASSADGMGLAAVIEGGWICTSTDGGATWTAREQARNWVAIVSSADGTKLAAAERAGPIYVSGDGGISWKARTDAGWSAEMGWRSLASSADGTTLAAVTWGGMIHTSPDGGETWVAHKRAGNRNWLSITASADGEKLAAVVSGGLVYTGIPDTALPWWDLRRLAGAGSRPPANFGGEGVPAGLWVGTVTVDQVSDGTQNNAPLQPAAGNFRFRILLHQDGGQNWKLLKEATIMRQKTGADETMVLVPQNRGKVEGFFRPGWQEKDDLILAEYHAIAYDFADPAFVAKNPTQPADGDAVTFSLTLPPDHRTHPMRHHYHPDLRQGQELTRTMTLSGLSVTADGSQFSAAYRETITGLRHLPVSTSGTALLRRVSDIDHLEQVRPGNQ